MFSRSVTSSVLRAPTSSSRVWNPKYMKTSTALLPETEERVAAIGIGGGARKGVFHQHAHAGQRFALFVGHTAGDGLLPLLRALRAAGASDCGGADRATTLSLIL